MAAPGSDELEDEPPERRVGHGRRAEDQDVVARADRAERAARETKGRVRELEAALAAAPTTAALEELDLKLRASEAEREELAATIKRLQTTVSERDADVALARDDSGARPDTKRINKLIADAESKVEAAERKAAAAEKKAEDAAKRATVTAERALEMEAQLKEAEQKAADAQELAAKVGKRGFGAERKVVEAQSHAREAQQKAGESAERATQAEKQVRELSGTAAEAERRAAASEKRALVAEQRVADVERRRRLRGPADVALRRSRDRGQAQADRGRARSARGQARPTRARDHEGVGHTSERQELEARIAELEGARRADDVELQPAQESFANTRVGHRR